MTRNCLTLNNSINVKIKISFSAFILHSPPSVINVVVIVLYVSLKYSWLNNFTPYFVEIKTVYAAVRPFNISEILLLEAENESKQTTTIVNINI